LEYFTTIGYILWEIGYFLVIWYIFPRFGILWHEKSGNPDPDVKIDSALEEPIIEARK
jgi:hypothetical protein